jgi:hypothetical protein
MGALLALLGGEFGGDSVKAVYVRGGLVSFQSMLDGPFCYFPHDAVVPGVVPSMDINSLVYANRKHPLKMEALVDGFNRSANQNALEALRIVAKGTTTVVREQPSSPAEVAAWLAAQLKK